MSAIAKTPQPPYYAVIFTSVRSEGDNGYEEMAAEMVEKGFSQPGFWEQKVSGTLPASVSRCQPLSDTRYEGF